MSDNTDLPFPPSEPSDSGVENEVYAQEAGLDAAEEVAEQKRRVWFMRMIRRERRREKVAKDRSMLINTLVTLGTTGVVAGTAMYATLKTSADGRLEDRRGARVDAIVEHWSATIADASTAIELLTQRSNDLWAYATALNEQGVSLDEALQNEATREKEYLSIRKDIASASARAGLVSSVSTTTCLDSFVSLIDTWQNALNYTRNIAQADGGLEIAVKAVAMQMENQGTLNETLSVVRKLAREELANAGTGNMKCNLPSADDVWKTLIPSEDTATEDTAPAEG